jgi:enoyl-CoA hydratase
MPTSIPSSPDDPVLYQRRGHRVTITLNRPEKKNALTPDLFDALEAALKRAMLDPARVLVLTGAADAFCAGADLSFLGSLGESAGQDAGTAIAEWQRHMVRYYKRFLLFAQLPMPTIAAINGPAVGAGFALALAGDLRIAANEAKIGATFAKLGIPPGGGTTYFLPRLIGLPRALELLYTGRLIDGREAERIGLVNRSVPRAELNDAVDALADEIAASAPRSVRAAKRTVLAELERHFGPSLELEAWGQVTLGSSRDAAEGIAALKERRPPLFQDD